MSMNIFSTLLNCAYDLDILHSEISEVKRYGDISIEQGIYILTSHGDIEIYATKTIDLKNGKPSVCFSSTFKSNINLEDVTVDYITNSIKNLIKSQLETEAFLSIKNYKDIVCTCELIV